MKLRSNIFYKILITLSPLLLAVLLRPFDQSGLSYTVGLVIAVIIGIPFIAIVGLTISFFTRNKPNAERLAIIGYFLAALPVWLYYLFQFYQLIS